ncbi:DddA-like double-stranded DNA deaminase toxin [Actinokineospora iranica]|uniref:SCP1.201-like deaminase n=1 Tax=Actinokineospora iranica TaxID=1271860 RepID=A0A1G6T851_9PSEU|nr:DddA-like double-stranded DNA deaminase toxin [Actinokineospora iranica]SDD25221.1 SCP1.201-like deaminase [Actinokineospora iranica]
MSIEHNTLTLYRYAIEVDELLAETDRAGRDFESAMTRAITIAGDIPQLHHYTQATLTTIAGVVQQLAALRLSLVACVAYHLTGSPSRSFATLFQDFTKAKALPVPHPQARDGAHYPPQTHWRARLMPDRHKKDGTRGKTVGWIHGDNWPTPTSTEEIPVISGRHDQWFHVAEEGLLRNGHEIENSRFLASHVEIKVATMMIHTGRRHVEISINHAPCADKKRRYGLPYPGCDTTLPRYLPAGATLTVHGTTEDGKPYTRTYTGNPQRKAPIDDHPQR